MGCSKKESVQEDNDAVEFYEKNSLGRIDDSNYQFKDDSAINDTNDDHVVTAELFYDADAIVYLGINSDDDYESVIRKLGLPYYDNPKFSPPSVVYLLRYNKTYAEIFFNEKTGKVSYIFVTENKTIV